MYADVLIMGTPSNYDQILTYQIPSEIKLQKGSLVSVPVRQRISQGLVLAVHNNKPNLSSLKEIRQILSDEPVITEAGLKLAFWLADYYVCSLSKVFPLFLPPAVRTKKRIVYVLNQSSSVAELLLQEKERKILEVLRANQSSGLTSQEIERKVQQPVQNDLEYLLENKFIRLETVFVPQVKSKEEVFFKIKAGVVGVEELLKRAPQQRKIYELLQKSPCSEKALKAKGLYSRSALQGLYEKKLLEIYYEEISRNPLLEKLSSERPQVLTPAQEYASKVICNNLQTEKRKWLLFGITGSGKTEVYLRVMQKVINRGRQVLYLVPEISLTPQIVSLLVEVFGDKEVAVLHSALSEGERYDQWKQA
jgi:primosomal protein N' (replication factor Y)